MRPGRAGTDPIVNVSTLRQCLDQLGEVQKMANQQHDADIAAIEARIAELVANAGGGVSVDILAHELRDVAGFDERDIRQALRRCFDSGTVRLGTGLQLYSDLPQAVAA